MIKTTIRAASILTASIGTFLHAQTFETLHKFEGADGLYPATAMTVGPDGALWGTTLRGGSYDAGVIFRYSTDDGQFSTEVDLDPVAVGHTPVARLLNIGDGNLYGACKGGSAGNTINNGGSVFRLDPDGALTVLHTIPAIQGAPYKAVYLAAGEPGALLVVCEDNSGIRRVPLNNGPVTMPPLFPGTPYPQSLIRASNGLMYGTTTRGAVGGAVGTLFKTAPDGTGYTKIYDAATANGSLPAGAMVQAPDGNLYGLMQQGGAIPSDVNISGVLYRLSLDGVYSVVHRFTDFDTPTGDLLLASDGMLYGAAQIVGPGGNGNGGVWRIKTDGTGYKVLHVFKTGPGGTYPTSRVPVGGLTQGRDGNIYGTTTFGLSGLGTIFRINLNLPAPLENLAPIAQDDTITSDGSVITIPVLANDFDPNNDPLFVEITSTPSAGTAVVKGVSIEYTPNGGAAANDSFTYRIIDSRGGESTATVNVTVNQVQIDVVGSYTGLMFLDEDFEGNDADAQARWTLSVLATGKFSGKLYTQGKTIPFKGTLSESNTAVVKVNVPSQGTATLFLNVVPGVTKSARAYFYSARNLSGIAGLNAASDSQAKRAYTVQVTDPSAPTIMPKGLGYATMAITPQGTVTAVGKLGDGSTLKWASQLITLPGGSKFLPVFSEPTKGGRIGGLLSATPLAGRDFEGTTHWFRSPVNSPKPKPYATGIDGEVDVTVGLYTPPARNALAMDFTNLGAFLSEGPNGEAGNSPISFSGTRFVPTDNLKSLSVTASSGLFSGVMKINNRSVPFKGVLNQGLRYGAGQFVVGGETGKAEIGE